ncbi:MAG: FeoB-associated Cys-rich membrane protein [Lachnospiraceae bacterium]|nr:FeoB-associated Cys-rich membrane protein [Lachnospiraceae bacterium]
MANVIVVGILALILGISVTYIVKAKKAGVKCIGCPAGATCSGHCNGTGSGDCMGSCSGCQSGTNK